MSIDRKALMRRVAEGLGVPSDMARAPVGEDDANPVVSPGAFVVLDAELAVELAVLGIDPSRYGLGFDE